MLEKSYNATQLLKHVVVEDGVCVERINASPTFLCLSERRPDPTYMVRVMVLLLKRLVLGTVLWP